MGQYKQWGIDGITEAEATIYFAKGEECCRFCPLLQTYSRNQCMLTGELIVEPKARGYHCPLKFKEDSNGD